MSPLPATRTLVPGLLALNMALLPSGCTRDRQAAPAPPRCWERPAAAPPLSVPSQFAPSPAAPGAPGPPAPSSSADVRARPSGNAPRVDFETRKTKGRIHTYVSYPKLTYPSAALSSAVNARIRRLVEHEEKAFQRLLRGSDPKDGYVSYYAVGCSVAYASEQLTSIGCDTYVFDGGAHGLKSYSTLNLLLPSLRELRLADVIRTDPESRRALFEACNTALTRPAKNAGATDEAPTLDEPWASVKFDTFTISQRGLVFYFKDQLPHVVADAVIPEVSWAALAPLLKTGDNGLPVDASRPFATADAPLHPWSARSEEDGQ